MSDDRTESMFEKGAAAWREVTTHQHTPGEECDGDEAFFLIVRSPKEGPMDIYTGGHRASAPTIVQSMVEVIDALIAKQRSDLDAMRAFMLSRDMIHAAADGIPPSPDASAGFSEFASRLGDE